MGGDGVAVVSCVVANDEAIDSVCFPRRIQFWIGFLLFGGKQRVRPFCLSPFMASVTVGYPNLPWQAGDGADRGFYIDAFHLDDGAWLCLG